MLSAQAVMRENSAMRLMLWTSHRAMSHCRTQLYTWIGSALPFGCVAAPQVVHWTCAYAAKARPSALTCSDATKVRALCSKCTVMQQYVLKSEGHKSDMTHMTMFSTQQCADPATLTPPQ